MSYAVFTMAKVNASLNSIGKHIERTAHPDNADPTRSHLNRNRLIKYPDGVSCLAEAVEHRIATAGLTRKVGPNQVRCITILMTSDNEAMQKIIKANKLDQWIADSIGYCRDTFGAENVVAASLHLDEYTPHLHVAVVPIVTTERKRKASEENVKRRYRTKPGNRARLSCNDIMTKDTMTRYQDEYALAVEKYGLERGIRGSKARHHTQHEYYRQCQIDVKVLEQDLSNLTDEKKKIGAEMAGLEADKRKLERGNRYYEGRIEIFKDAAKRLEEDTNNLSELKDSLEKSYSSLKGQITQLTNEKNDIETEKKKAAEERDKITDEKKQLASERENYIEQTEAARKEVEEAKREAAEAKAERDRQKKEAVSNIANIFTGSKTKRLEAEIADRDRTIENLKLQMSSQQEKSSREIWNLNDSLRRQQEQHESYKRGFDSQMARIDKYFPSVSLLMPAILDCESVRMSEGTIKALLDCKPHNFSEGARLYDPLKEKDIDVGRTEVQIKRDPTDGNRFRLHINGSRIFQWFKDQWQRLTQKFSRAPRL